jgi:hypothetical protein
MGSTATRRWRLQGFLAVSCLCSFLAIAFTADTASGGIAESRLAIGPDGVEFDLREVPRREVLERLFAGLGIKLEWGSRAVADDPISGRYHGTRSSVARQLLEHTNFIVEYGRVNDKSQVVRVRVLGRAAGGKPPSGFAALETALQRESVPEVSPESGGLPAPVAKPNPDFVPKPAAGGPVPVPQATAGAHAIPIPSAPPSDLVIPGQPRPAD